MKKNNSLYGVLFLALAQLLVGVNIVCTKLLLSTIPILIVISIRFFLASLVLLPLHWLTSDRKKSLKVHLSKVNRRDWLFLFGQALSAGILFNCLMISGLNYTDANVAGIIMSALPAIIAIMSWFFLREIISTQKIFCIAFAVIGLLIIAVNQFYNQETHNHSFLGNFLIILSLLPEAGYYILCKIYPNKFPLFFTSFLLNGMNALLLLPILWFTHWNPLTIPLTSWGTLFILGLSSGLFYVCWFKGVQWVDSTTASLCTALMPVATVVLAWVILGESINALEFLGMGLVLFSILFYARK